MFQHVCRLGWQRCVSVDTWPFWRVLVSSVLDGLLALPPVLWVLGTNGNRPPGPHGNYGPVMNGFLVKKKSERTVRREEDGLCSVAEVWISPQHLWLTVNAGVFTGG